MKINLEEFFLKKVDITFRNGKTLVCRIIENNSDEYPYLVVFYDTDSRDFHSYTKDGSYSIWGECEEDIVIIKPHSSQNSMGLSYKTIKNLADVLTPEVIDFIQKDERWTEFMHEIIPDILVQKMGKIDDELHFDLSMEIMERITLTQSK